MKTLKTLLIFKLMSIGLPLFSQTSTGVYSTVTDDKNKPIENVNVLLLKALDSSLVKGTITNTEGKFDIQALPGNYLLSLSKIGYKIFYSKPFIIEEAITLDIGNITLIPDAKSMKE